MNKKQLTLALGVILIFIGFIAYEKHISLSSQTSGGAMIPAGSTSGNNSGLALNTNTATSYTDGTYTGPVVNAFYGNVQVAVTISGGKITDVQFLQYPNSTQENLRKSQMAMPILKQEVIAAQSANVDTVSGATQTADGFKESISSALAQASK